MEGALPAGSRMLLALSASPWRPFGTEEQFTFGSSSLGLGYHAQNCGRLKATCPKAFLGLFAMVCVGQVSPHRRLTWAGQTAQHQVAGAGASSGHAGHSSSSPCSVCSQTACAAGSSRAPWHRSRPGSWPGSPPRQQSRDGISAQGLKEAPLPFRLGETLRLVFPAALLEQPTLGAFVSPEKVLFHERRQNTYQTLRESA